MSGLRFEDVVLGVAYRDCVTDFVGTATAKCEYLDERRTVELTPRVQDNGTVIPSVWFSPTRLEPANHGAYGFKPKGDSK